jgi:hypothetical protein
MRYLSSRTSLCILGAGVALFGALDTASAAELPPALQAALIAKILQSDTTLHARGRDTAKLAIISTPSSAASVAPLDEALGPTQIATRNLTPEGLLQVAEAPTVVYILGTEGAAAVNKFCCDHGVLCIAARTEMAEAGQAAVAIGLKDDGRPEIVVNMRQLTSQRHTLAPTLLKVARLIQGE